MTETKMPPDLTDAEIAEVATKARDAYGLDDADWYDHGSFDLADPADAAYSAHASPACVLSLAIEVQRLRAENEKLHLASLYYDDQGKPPSHRLAKSFCRVAASGERFPVVGIRNLIACYLDRDAEAERLRAENADLRRWMQMANADMGTGR